MRVRWSHENQITIANPLRTGSAASIPISWRQQHLVRDGVAYARSAHGAAEPPLKVDLDTFLESLVYDYQDGGKQIGPTGRIGVPVTTRPRALRRVIGNLVDNAIKYAGTAEIEASAGNDGKVSISVLDRGAGLGLAIAQQLALAMGGALTLRNREEGGLQVTLTLEQDGSSPHQGIA